MAYNKINTITDGPLLLKHAIQVHIEPRLPKQMLEKITKARLLRTIKDAYKNVPFYKEYYDKEKIDLNTIKTFSDIKYLPFLTKEHVRQNFPGKLLSKLANLDKCYISGTTGSTGKSVNFAYSKSTFFFYLSTSLRVYTMIGYKPWYKMAFIKYTPLPVINIPGLPLFKTYHIPSIAPIEKQMELLREYHPDLLAGYASIIYEMAHKLTPYDKKIIKPKIISLNSELSTEEEREFISQAFSCPVYDEYSTEETWMVASQCKFKNYHLFIDNVYVEFLNDSGEDVKEGEIGEIVLTTLRSPVMPFIRYKIGDLGSFSLKDCPCGRKFPLLKSFEGRADDIFILPSGKKISSLKLLNTFTKFIKSDPKLMNEFKLVQDKIDHATIYLIPGEEYSNTRFSELVEQLNQILEKSIKITTKIVDSIDNQGKIKRKAIESLVSKSNK
jgi:phenylacetate-CoA ligase